MSIILLDSLESFSHPRTYLARMQSFSPSTTVEPTSVHAIPSNAQQIANTRLKMPNPELTQYFDSLPADKLLRYKPMRQEKNIHQGVDYRYDHQGGSQPSRGLTDNSNTNTMQSFKSNGKEYHNVQVQLNKQAKSVNLKGLSRRNGTCPSAACVLVAYDWEGPEAVLRAALEQSNDLGSGDGKYCRKIWLYEEYVWQQRALKSIH